jgi:hypothetical protein
MATAPLLFERASASFAPDAVLLQEAPFSFEGQKGSRLNQRSSKPGLSDLDRTAIKALEFIYPISEATGWEWGAQVCEQPNGLVWTKFVTSSAQNTVATDVLTTCKPYGLSKARLHTHPPGEGSDPSGFVVYGADTDIWNADHRPELVFYMKSPAPNSSGTQILRFQKIPSVSSAGCNTQKLSGTNWTAHPWSQPC